MSLSVRNLVKNMKHWNYSVQSSLSVCFFYSKNIPHYTGQAYIQGLTCLQSSPRCHERCLSGCRLNTVPRNVAYTNKICDADP